MAPGRRRSTSRLRSAGTSSSDSLWRAARGWTRKTRRAIRPSMSPRVPEAVDAAAAGEWRLHVLKSRRCCASLANRISSRYTSSGGHVRRAEWVCVVVGFVLLLTAVQASAQSGSSIAGVVKDTTGAVLPGVTVEASSPALIEKVRSAVTDAAGQYKIVNLVPGTYTVTFTLTGFNTVRREG